MGQEKNVVDRDGSPWPDSASRGNVAFRAAVRQEKVLLMKL